VLFCGPGRSLVTPVPELLAKEVMAPFQVRSRDILVLVMMVA